LLESVVRRLVGTALSLVAVTATPSATALDVAKSGQAWSLGVVMPSPGAYQPQGMGAIVTRWSSARASSIPEALTAKAAWSRHRSRSPEWRSSGR